MRVEQLLTKDVLACSPSHGLKCAPQSLRQGDCGMVLGTAKVVWWVR